MAGGVVHSEGNVWVCGGPRPEARRGYQCTPGTNRTARLTGPGTRSDATARAGRFGRRAEMRLVGDWSVCPCAAAESG